MTKYAEQIERIRESAHELHRSVNQTYGDELPYGYHLDMVDKWEYIETEDIYMPVFDEDVTDIYEL